MSMATGSFSRRCSPHAFRAMVGGHSERSHCADDSPRHGHALRANPGGRPWRGRSRCRRHRRVTRRPGRRRRRRILPGGQNDAGAPGKGGSDAGAPGGSAGVAGAGGRGAAGADGGARAVGGAGIDGGAGAGGGAGSPDGNACGVFPATSVWAQVNAALGDRAVVSIWRSHRPTSGR